MAFQTMRQVKNALEAAHPDEQEAITYYMLCVWDSSTEEETITSTPEKLEEDFEMLKREFMEEEGALREMARGNEPMPNDWERWLDATEDNQG